MARPRIDAIDGILAAMPGTRVQIMERTGFTKSVIARNIRLLHEAGWTHIRKWEPAPSGGKNQAVFTAGAGKDRTCTLKPQSAAVSQARWQAKARKTGAYEERSTRLRARYWANKAKTKQQSWLSALLP